MHIFLYQMQCLLYINVKQKENKRKQFARNCENEYIADHNNNGDYLQINFIQALHRNTISSNCHIDNYNKSLMHDYVFSFFFTLTIDKSSILARTRNRVYVLIYIVKHVIEKKKLHLSKDNYHIKAIHQLSLLYTCDICKNPVVSPSFKILPLQFTCNKPQHTVPLKI